MQLQSPDAEGVVWYLILYALLQLASNGIVAMPPAQDIILSAVVAPCHNRAERHAVGHAAIGRSTSVQENYLTDDMLPDVAQPVRADRLL